MKSGVPQKFEGIRWPILAALFAFNEVIWYFALEMEFWLLLPLPSEVLWVVQSMSFHISLFGLLFLTKPSAIYSLTGLSRFEFYSIRPFIAIILVNVAFVLINGFISFYLLGTLSVSKQPSMLTAGSALVVAPVFEEFFYRKYIIDNLEGTSNRRFTYILSVVLFTLVHLLPNPLNLPRVIGALIGGVILGSVYMKYRSLVFNIILHVFYNALAFFAPLWLRLMFVDYAWF
ncbi:MAG: CPBP family intramembrane metalloprotease [Cyclobacteriaceae bacterium]|nr:CPBP family intramembrane metalloprotease [Cyclobacteriaceae bacterium HetDA_MAG_MS6]